MELGVLIAKSETMPAAAPAWACTQQDEAGGRDLKVRSDTASACSHGESGCSQPEYNHDQHTYLHMALAMIIMISALTSTSHVLPSARPPRASALKPSISRSHKRTLFTRASLQDLPASTASRPGSPSVTAASAGPAAADSAAEATRAAIDSKCSLGLRQPTVAEAVAAATAAATAVPCVRWMSEVAENDLSHPTNAQGVVGMRTCDEGA